MQFTLSGFSLDSEFIPSHEQKILQTQRYAKKENDNFLNFFVYCDDDKKEILRVGCNKGGVVSFIESKICVPKSELDYCHKQFLNNALEVQAKRLPSSYLANLNDLNLNMGFASWDGVIDNKSGNLLIVGACYDKGNTQYAFWTKILISPVMLDYNKATMDAEQRFSLGDMQDLYSDVNK
jgi:hypothetical protein